jgi:outer membrane protein OmpA-like peptidoglycan-associated protein
LRTFNKTILMLGTALLLQGCQTMGDDQIAVTNNVADTTFSQTAEEMTGGSVKVYSLDEPVPPPPVAFNDAGPGFALQAPDQGVGTDPNVMVFPIDDTMPPPVFTGAPALMPPAPEVPYSSPFPAAAPAPLMLNPPGSVPPPLMAYEPGVTVNGAQIFFPHGSSRVSATGKQVIDDVIRRGSGMVEVVGHASARAEANDPVEKRIVNLKMSMDRAFKVSSALMRNGVPAEAIVTTAYGDTRPAGGEDVSRRVEILTRP